MKDYKMPSILLCYLCFFFRPYLIEKRLQRLLPAWNLTKSTHCRECGHVELDRAMQLFLADAGFAMMNTHELYHMILVLDVKGL